MRSPAKWGFSCLLFAVGIFIACAPPPVPNIALPPQPEPTNQAATAAPRTFTPTNIPQTEIEETPTAEPNALTRPIVSVTRRGISAYRALNFCEVPQSVRLQNRERVYCLHPEKISFDQVVTALGEVMNARFGLRDAQGNALVYDEARRCEFNLCYAYVWYDKQNPKNAYALLRLYPRQVSEREIAPLLEVRPNGDPQVLTDWQIVLVDQRSAEIVQVLANPFIAMARSDAIAFNPASGYFEVLDRSGANPRPTGKRLGLALGAEQTTQLTDSVQDIALYNFNATDAAFFKTAVNWLAENMPTWYAYLLAQRPFEVHRDASLPFLSDGICCRTRNGEPTFGRIRFRDHLADWTRDAFPGAAHDALTRWSFLTTLIHEATHVRDLRTNRFNLNAVPTGMRDCVMHISTDEIEILFSQDAALEKISPSALTQQEYVATIEEFSAEVKNKLLPEKQKVCGIFYKPTFDGLMP